MVIILAIFIWIFARAISNAWPLLNLPIGELSVIQISVIIFWIAVGLIAAAGFAFAVRWWINNGILFKPSKWRKTWFLFGIARWILIFGLFYLIFISSTNTETENSIITEHPWLGSFSFIFFSIGIYERLSEIRAWWELKNLPPDLVLKNENDFTEYQKNFDPVAYKLGLIRIRSIDEI